MPELSRTGASIELRELAKTYGDTPAVAGITLDIRPGEFMTFLGPSGSGKTTTLNMIAGFISPSAGDIRVDGTSLDKTPTYRRNMGMVFQGYALFPHLTVAENVAFPLRQRKVDKRGRRALVASALETVQLTGLGDRRPAELSGGQQQRVALARAIVYRPPVLLMDEPLGALDKKLRETLQDEVRTIHQEVGTTFVYVTHDQEEALSLSDRIAVYNEGRIEQVGTGKDLYDNPESLFVAQFIGDSTRIRGSIDEQDRAILRTGDQRVAVENPHRMHGANALVLRPERIRLRRPDSTSSSPGHAMEVTVLDAVFLGHSRRVTVRLPSGETGLVRELPGQDSQVAAGEKALAVWDPSDGVLLADSDSDRHLDQESTAA